MEKKELVSVKRNHSLGVPSARVLHRIVTDAKVKRKIQWTPLRLRGVKSRYLEPPVTFLNCVGFKSENGLKSENGFKKLFRRIEKRQMKMHLKVENQMKRMFEKSR